MTIVLFAIGIIVAPVGTVYPVIYYQSQGIVDGAEVEKGVDQSLNTEIRYAGKWTTGDFVTFHDKVREIAFQPGVFTYEGGTWAGVLKVSLVTFASGLELIVDGDVRDSFRKDDVLIVKAEVIHVVPSGGQYRGVEIIRASLDEVQKTPVESILGVMVLTGFALMVAAVLLFKLKVPEENTRREDQRARIQRFQEMRARAAVEGKSKCPRCGLTLSLNKSINRWQCDVCGVTY